MFGGDPPWLGHGPREKTEKENPGRGKGGRKKVQKFRIPLDK